MHAPRPTHPPITPKSLTHVFADAMPVEIVQFCWEFNLRRLRELPEVAGCDAKLRLAKDGTPYVTDNGNYIVDLYFQNPIKANSGQNGRLRVRSLASLRAGVSTALLRPPAPSTPSNHPSHPTQICRTRVPRRLPSRA